MTLADETDECVVCMDRVANCVLLPCLHRTMCITCAARVPRCPRCNQMWTTRRPLPTGKKYMFMVRPAWTKHYYPIRLSPGKRGRVVEAERG